MSYLVLPLIERGEWGGRCGWAAYFLGQVTDAIKVRQPVFRDWSTMQEAIWDNPVPAIFSSDELDNTDCDGAFLLDDLPADWAIMDCSIPSFVLSQDGTFCFRAFGELDELIETDPINLEEIQDLIDEQDE